LQRLSCCDPRRNELAQERKRPALPAGLQPAAQDITRVLSDDGHTIRIVLEGLRVNAVEKLELIRLVEGSVFSIRQTLKEIGLARLTFYAWYKRKETIS
jgi:hypothetical protein